MQSIPGVIDAESGYANGTCEADADYKTVCKGETEMCIRDRKNMTDLLEDENTQKRNAR